MSKKVKTMVRLSPEQIKQKKVFVENYMDKSTNAASGSSVDANANVSTKTVATLGAEMWKDCAIQLNRSTLCDYIEKRFDKETADKYVELLEDHQIYKHDETSISPGTPYCVSITMYPFLLDGMTKLGGESKAPKHLDSFCGSFQNLCFAISAQFAGALATGEFLLYFHYFAVKDYGKDYLVTHCKEVDSHLQQVVYTLNQPSAARGGQSLFWNLSIFDRYYFETMFGNFYFPDGTHINYEDFLPFQKYFMEWFLGERKKSLLTFPVITEASLDENGEPKDKEWLEWIADIRSRGLSFFTYNSESADALSSCCRLRNEIDDNDFSFSLGAGGIQTGSIGVMTTLLRSVGFHSILYHLKNNGLYKEEENELKQVREYIDNNQQESEDIFFKYLEEIIDYLHKFQVSFRDIVCDYIDAGLLTVYTAGYINIDKQFMTLGVNSMNECAELFGYEVSNNTPYLKFVSKVLGTYKRKNKEARTKYSDKPLKFNTELVPGENLSYKSCQWDKKSGIYDGYRNCYNSYIFLPESDLTSIPDKFEMHGGIIADNMDGGQL